MIPWLEDDAGYHHIEPWDDSSWAMMMRPGASGRGLLVASVEPHSDGQYIDQVFDPFGAWLIPAVVTWHSVIDENGRLADWAQEDIEQIISENSDMEGPPVALMGESAWTADGFEEYRQSVQAQNVHYKQMDFEDVDSSLDFSTGYCSVLKVKPITEQAFQDIRLDIVRANSELQLSSLSIGGQKWSDWADELQRQLDRGDRPPDEFDIRGKTCHCPIKLVENDYNLPCASNACTRADEGAHLHRLTSYRGQIACEVSGYCPCLWDVDEAACRCGEQEPTLAQHREHLDTLVYAGLITVKNDIIRPAYHELWDYSVNRYLSSLLTYADNLAGGLVDTLNEEDWMKKWFTSSWRLQSPYWDTRSLSQHLQKLSHPSTGLVRSLAS